MFGAVMTTGKRDKQAGRVQGPVQIGFSRSVDRITSLDIGITRITSLDIGITRVTPTKEEDLKAWLERSETTDGKNKGKETEMGSKHVVPYALYRGTSPPVAVRCEQVVEHRRTPGTTPYVPWHLPFGTAPPAPTAAWTL
ncbi:type I CRISPR-associated protein Cas7 [Streptomyces anulatus]